MQVPASSLPVPSPAYEHDLLALRFELGSVDGIAVGVWTTSDAEDADAASALGRWFCNTVEQGGADDIIVVFKASRACLNTAAHCCFPALVTPHILSMNIPTILCLLWAELRGKWQEAAKFIGGRLGALYQLIPPVGLIRAASLDGPVYEHRASKCSQRPPITVNVDMNVKSNIFRYAKAARRSASEALGDASPGSGKPRKVKRRRL
ncbi:hypothetical protein GGX14DRAFT_399842 [Mycena pura]|uniref:Uncharacterized protein n=1 Tax=Mycena pura TaxID=153505 RepID=A0AAD6V7P7_9AGAR|nr:hypothetical protein GGX14DRAFT_399842 [Mycena pura]